MFKNVRKVTKLDKMIIISRYNKLKAHSKNPMNERRKNSKRPGDNSKASLKLALST